MKLDTAESLVILRRRAGVTQREAAARYGVSLTRYQRWELGLDTPELFSRERKSLEKKPATAGERCFIARRRKGWTLEQVSSKVGYCRMWVNRMESDELDPKPLLKLYGRAAA